MSSENAIEVSNVSKCFHIYSTPFDRLKQIVAGGRKTYYDEFWALQPTTFQIKKKQTVGIIGRNGSGKSTLLQIICGTLSPTTGEVKTNGRVAALLELGAGFNPEFTGIENARVAASLYGLSPEEIEMRLDAIAAFAEIGEHLYQPVKTYSSGMYVRLAFAVIAHVDADILVIDEALAVGDAYFTQKCMRFLRLFMQQGTVIFVSHDTGAIVNLCDTVLWLDRGKMVRLGEPKQVSEDYLASLFEDSPPPANTTKHNPLSADSAACASELTHPPSLQEQLPSNGAFSFEAQLGREFGEGGARIERVIMVDTNGHHILQCSGGELVELVITVRAHRDLEQPIVGFFFKDRLGQVIFAENTFLTYQHKELLIKKESTFTVRFRFQLPTLPQGDYSLAAAVATGTPSNHRQQHWIHDALFIRSISNSVPAGLVGIPMDRIELET
jgi:lipopolysaccharide transport system ATP-binding protein